jgi:hypothetical protein
MNKEVADILLDKITGLSWVDKYAGVVRVVTQSVSNPTPLNPEGTIKKFFPVSCRVTNDQCDNQTLTELAPNSAYKSVLYFEDLGLSVIDADSVKANMRSTLKLVVWLNGKKLGYDGCGLSAIAELSILKAFSEVRKGFNEGNFTRITIDSPVIDPKSSAIFSKYSYDESKTQYLLHPNDYFSMTIQTSFTVPFSCIDDFEVLAEDPC